MRSTLRRRKPYGRRAKRWWASGSERHRRRKTPYALGQATAKATPSAAHLPFHRLQRFPAADADLFLVRLEAADNAPAARLHAGTKPLEVGLAIFHRRSLLSKRVRG